MEKFKCVNRKIELPTCYWNSIKWQQNMKNMEKLHIEILCVS